MILTRREIGIAAALLGTGCRKANRPRSFTLSATVDFPDDLGFGPYSPALLDDAMGILRRLGVTRVYWMFYPDCQVRKPGATIWDWDAVPYGRQTLDLLGDPLQAAVNAAHQHGMEIICCLKPFNAGIAVHTPKARIFEWQRRFIESAVAYSRQSLSYSNTLLLESGGPPSNAKAPPWQ